MKILIIKTSSLGDIIHAFDAVGFLRQKFPTAQIDWVVEKGFAEMVRAHPGVNRVICVDTKLWRKKIFNRSAWKEILEFRKELRAEAYDVVFDLQGNIKSGLVCSQVIARAKVGFAKPTVSEWPNTFFTNARYNPPAGQNVRREYLYVVQSFFNDFTPFEDPGVLLTIASEQRQRVESILKNPLLVKRKRIMVCPGSAWPNKQMTSVSLEDFLRRVDAEGPTCFLFIWGSAEERVFVESLQAKFANSSFVVDRLPLPVLQNLMNEMDVVIAMDSLPLHLAGTTSTATFSVFGASSSQKYKPPGSRHTSLQGACPFNRTFERRCPILRTCPTGACIRSLEGDVVSAAFAGKHFAEKQSHR